MIIPFKKMDIDIKEGKNVLYRCKLWDTIELCKETRGGKQFKAQGGNNQACFYNHYLVDFVGFVLFLLLLLLFLEVCLHVDARNIPREKHKRGRLLVLSNMRLHVWLRVLSTLKVVTFLSVKPIDRVNQLGKTNLQLKFRENPIFLERLVES